MSIFRTLVYFSLHLLLMLSSFSVRAENCLGGSSQKALMFGHELRSKGQYLLSSQQYSLSKALSCDSNMEFLAEYYFATSLVHLQENAMAENILLDLRKRSLSPELSAKVQSLLGWTNVVYIPKLDLKIQQSFENYISEKSRIEEQRVLKSPWLAGTLSAVIPGLGQIYNQNYSSAAFAFVLNALFLSSSLELQKNGLPASALVSTTLFSITYLGNILSSVDSSKQINTAYQKPFLEEARKKHLSDLDL